MEIIDHNFIEYWSDKYEYDDSYYDNNIIDGRKGDTNSLRKLTEWKNASIYNKPMPFHKNEKKEKAFQYLISNLNKFLNQTNSREVFISLFPNNGNSLIWSKFWYHVFFGDPIYDVYTNASFIYFTIDIKINENESRQNKFKTWEHYNSYCAWVNTTMNQLKNNGLNIDLRKFDKAIFEFGKIIINSVPDETTIIANEEPIIGRVSILPSLKEINFSYSQYLNRLPNDDTEIILKFGKYELRTRIGKKSNNIYLKSPTKGIISFNGERIHLSSYEDFLEKMKLCHGDKIFIIEEHNENTYTVIQLLREYIN